MTVRVPRLPFALDPLMAEAKRRMRRRRFLVAVAILAIIGTAAGLTVSMRSPGSSGQTPATIPSHLGFAALPGLTKIASSTWSASLCADSKGTSQTTPSYWYCAQRGHHSQQVWALTAAVRKYGIHQVPQPVPLTVARRHPGASEVVVDVLTLRSASVARRFFPIDTRTAGYTALPQAAINGGIAGRIDSLANDGLREFRFAWLSGTSVVDVNILGADMTPGQARHVALLARPS
jgi:hypothetical protein